MKRLPAKPRSTVHRRTSRDRLRRKLVCESLESRLALDASFVITEVVANNRLGIKDEDGDRSDWIEIYNNTDTEADLTGWFLTDDASEQDKWQFPSVRLSPREHLVVFASGKSRARPDTPLHTNFRIDSDGEYLALLRPDGTTIESKFSPAIPNQFADISYGLVQEDLSAALISEVTPLTYQVPAADDTLELDAWTQLDFDDQDWSAGSVGIGFDRSGDFASHIATDVAVEMLGVNASIRIRIPFTMPHDWHVNKLALRMRYDDGFVAFVNGQEIARRNAPDVLDHQSRATQLRSERLAIEFEEIELSHLIGELPAGLNVLTIQGLNRATRDRDMLIVPELVAHWAGSVESSPAQYFQVPTPGRPNGSQGFENKVSEPLVSVDHGFFVQPQQIVLHDETPGSTIVYTTDGSIPSWDNGYRISAPDGKSAPTHLLELSKTTTLRFVGLEPRHIGSDVHTRTYIFVDDVIRQSSDGMPPDGWPTEAVNGQLFDYGMDPDVVENPQFSPLIKEALVDLPSISIVTDLANLVDETTGIYVNAEVASGEPWRWERPASVELLNPDGSEGFQIDAGLRIRGGASRTDDNPKHSFRLMFRGEYGDTKLRYPMFGIEGADEFDNLDLRTAQIRSWSWCVFDHPRVGSTCGENTFLRDVFVRDTQGDMGQPYTRSRYYHVYLNGQYWGLYQSEERPEASFAETYFGGDADDYDVVKVETDPRRVVATDGTIDAWRQLWELANLGFGENEAYYGVQGLDRDGIRDPDLPVLLDVDDLIDYMLLTFYVGNEDGPIADFGLNNITNNWFGIRHQSGESGFRFLAHDAEWGLGDLDKNRLGPWSAGENFEQSNPQWIHQKLWENSEYRLRFADRAQRFLFEDGAATPTAALDRIQERINQIDLAIIAESARWGDTWREQPYTKNDWEQAVDYLVDTYLPNRTQVVIDQLRNASIFDQAVPLYPHVAAPVFSQRGGEVAAGFALELSAPDTIYFTRDGSDPRQGPESVAWQTVLAQGAGLRYFVPTDDVLQNDWTRLDFDDSQWPQGTTPIGFGSQSEPIGSDIRDEVLGENASVYARTEFHIDRPDQVQRMRLRMRYDDGFVAFLNGSEVARVNAPDETDWNSLALLSRSGIANVDLDLTVFVDLLRPGKNVWAIHGLNSRVSSKDFVIAPELDVTRIYELNMSPSAEVYDAPIRIDSNTLVRARALRDGEWSALTEAVFSTDRFPLRLDEIMYHSAAATANERAAGFLDDDDFDFLEFVNTSASETVALSGVTISGGVEFAFPDISVASGERVVVASNRDAFTERYGFIPNLIGEIDQDGGAGRLSNRGETLVLKDNLGRIVQTVTYEDDWYPITDGDGKSLQIVSPTSYRLLQASRPDAWHPSVVVQGSPGSPGRRIGDSNQDGVFDPADLVQVFLTGKYEDADAINITFDDGDWNQDGEFDSSDLVLAFQTGSYVNA